MDKVIVTVAPTSNFHGKKSNPALPYSPQEVAEAVYDSWNEGASIVHIHGRDEKGLPTNDPTFFEEADRLIRKKNCDIILQHSMAAANPILLGTEEGDIDDGLNTSKTTPPPEMVSLELAPTKILFKGKAYPYAWDRLWAERAAKDLMERGIKPEIEICNNSDMDDLEYLIEKEVLKKPHYVSFVLGMHEINNQASRYSPKHVMHLVDILPANSIYSVLAVGVETQFQAITLSLILGGNVRVGFEDNIYIKRDRLAESNAQVIKKVVRIARDLGREIASPAEAREMLGLRQLDVSQK